MRDQAQEFLYRFSSDRSVWTSFSTEQRKKRWWIVPRWSLPVWKVSNRPIMNGSGLTALFVVDAIWLEMLQQPEMFLGPDIVEELMNRVARDRPETVKEARAARGDRIPQDLAEIVRRGRSLVHLPELLDAMAHYPQETPVGVAELVLRDINTPHAGLSRRASGPWPVRPAGESAQRTKGTAAGPSVEAYREALRVNPLIRHPIRVQISQNLELQWRSGKIGLASPLAKRIEDLQEAFMRQYGLSLPWFRFRGPDDSQLVGMAFRLEVLNARRDP